MLTFVLRGELKRAVRNANDENGLRTCAVRLSGLVGGKNNKIGMDRKFTVVGQGDFPSAWVSVKSAAKVHLLAERYLTREIISTTNVFNAVSGNCTHRDLITKSSLLAQSVKPSTAPRWLVLMAAYMNELVYWTTGLTPMGTTCTIMLDFLLPMSISGEHTEKELGWVEKRPWEVVLEECFEEYKQLE